MTYEEAILIFEKNNYIDTLGGFPYSEDEQKIVDAYDIIEQILEKQIPKKPLYPKSKICQNIRCPMCNSLVGDMHVQYYYCPDCGQALDWKE